jgi:hypothetical protein
MIIVGGSEAIWCGEQESMVTRKAFQEFLANAVEQVCSPDGITKLNRREKYVAIYAGKDGQQIVVTCEIKKAENLT